MPKVDKFKCDVLHHFPTFFHALKKVYSDQKMKIDDVLSNRHENDITWLFFLSLPRNGKSGGEEKEVRRK